MRYLISYDIGNARRRVRVVRALEGYGHRVQESVFVVDLGTAQWTALRERLVRLVDPVADQWRAWRLCADDQRDERHTGLSKKQPPPGPLVI